MFIPNLTQLEINNRLNLVASDSKGWVIIHKPATQREIGAEKDILMRVILLAYSYTEN